MGTFFFSTNNFKSSGGLKAIVQYSESQLRYFLFCFRLKDIYYSESCDPSFSRLSIYSTDEQSYSNSQYIDSELEIKGYSGKF